MEVVAIFEGSSSQIPDSAINAIIEAMKAEEGKREELLKQINEKILIYEYQNENLTATFFIEIKNGEMSLIMRRGLDILSRESIDKKELYEEMRSHKKEFYEYTSIKVLIDKNIELLKGMV